MSYKFKIDDKFQLNEQQKIEINQMLSQIPENIFQGNPSLLPLVQELWIIDGKIAEIIQQLTTPETRSNFNEFSFQLIKLQINSIISKAEKNKQNFDALLPFIKSITDKMKKVNELYESSIVIPPSEPTLALPPSEPKPALPSSGPKMPPSGPKPALPSSGPKIPPLEPKPSITPNQVNIASASIRMEFEKFISMIQHSNTFDELRRNLLNLNILESKIISGPNPDPNVTPDNINSLLDYQIYLDSSSVRQKTLLNEKHEIPCRIIKVQQKCDRFKSVLGKKVLNLKYDEIIKQLNLATNIDKVRNILKNELKILDTNINALAPQPDNLNDTIFDLLYQRPRNLDEYKNIRNNFMLNTNDTTFRDTLFNKVKQIYPEDRFGNTKFGYLLYGQPDSANPGTRKSPFYGGKNIDFEYKYLKYKQKYLNLVNYQNNL